MMVLAYILTFAILQPSGGGYKFKIGIKLLTAFETSLKTQIWKELRGRVGFAFFTTRKRKMSFFLAVLSLPFFSPLGAVELVSQIHFFENLNKIGS